MGSNLFFAIELSGEARAGVHAYTQVWRNALDERADVKWYAPEDYHITLKFLGTHEPCEEGAFITLGRIVAGDVESASLEIGLTPERFAPRRDSVVVRPDGPGAFPSFDRPRVLWVGAQRAVALVDLARRIDDISAAFGIPRNEARYRPHITVARCRGLEGIVAPDAAGPIFPEHVQDHFVLMRTSDPKERKSSEKLRYNTVQAFAL